MYCTEISLAVQYHSNQVANTTVATATLGSTVYLQQLPPINGPPHKSYLK